MAIQRRLRNEYLALLAISAVVVVLVRRDTGAGTSLVAIGLALVAMVLLKLRWRRLAREARVAMALPEQRRAAAVAASSSGTAAPTVETVTFRARGMVATPILFTLLMAVTWGSTIAKGPEPAPRQADWLVGIGFVVVGAAISLPWCWSGLVVGPEGVVVRRPLATRSIPWDDVASASVNRWGIVVLRYDGSAPTAISLGSFRWLGSDGSRLPQRELAERITSLAVALGDGRGAEEPPPP